MNIKTNPTTAISSTPRRIILASAYRHERHSTGRQERAFKSLRRMGRTDETEVLPPARARHVFSTNEALDE